MTDDMVVSDDQRLAFESGALVIPSAECKADQLRRLDPDAYR